MKTKVLMAAVAVAAFTSATPALACSIWEPSEYENGTAGRSEREAADFVFLARVERVDPGADHLTSVRFVKVASLSGEGPSRLTADGDFWTCYSNPVAARIDWRPGQLAVVYGRRVGPLRLSDSFWDRPSWDGWQLLEAVPADRNRDPRIATALAAAQSRLRSSGR
jgi:hypothetical protein